MNKNLPFSAWLRRSSTARAVWAWFPDLVTRLYLSYLRRKERKKLTHREFVNLSAAFGNDFAGRAKYMDNAFHCRTTMDPSFIRIVKKLRTDFSLTNFVETGTYDGDTSFVMSMLFDRVFTCDVKDHPRRPEFYFRDNLVYETLPSPEFFRKHIGEMAASSLFFLDAHWYSYWPLRDELAFVFKECRDPVVIIDDFDAGNGLGFDSYHGIRLDIAYISDLVPPHYKFFMNPWSNRDRGLIVLFPGTADYGCLFAERGSYSSAKHSLWDASPVH